MRPGWDLDTWCRKVIAEFDEGDYVNLGYGLPLRIARYRPADYRWIIHSENGSLGCGDVIPPDDADADLVNPQGDPIALYPGAAFLSSAESFALMRGHHLDVSVLGALQVSERGDLANWCIPGQPNGGVGGAMDLAVGAKRVIAMLEHRSRDGAPKVLPSCTLPLTGHRCVQTIVTDLAVLDVTPTGLRVRDLAPNVSPEQLRAWTAAPLDFGPAD